MTERQTSTIERIQISLVLSLLGVGVNLFLSINIIGESQLLFGSIFVFLALLILPISFSLLVATCVFLSQIALDQFLTTSLLFLLELTVIIVLLQRNMFLLMASLLYWVVIGGPLLYVFNFYSPGELASGNIIITLQTAFNGLLNAAIAVTIYTSIPHSWLQSKVLHQHSLATNIFAICASTLVAPLLIACFVFIAEYSNQSDASTIDSLKNKSLRIGQLTTHFIAQHQVVIEQLAHTISNLDRPEIERELLLKAQEENNTFFNIALVDKNAELGFFAPEKYNEQIARMPADLRTIADRSYFIEAKSRLTTIISDTILSRGVVIAPMFAIAAPLFKKNSNRHPEFDGIIFGAIKLNNLDSVTNEIASILEHTTVVVTDSQNNIVYSTKPSVLKALDPFFFTIGNSILIDKMPIMQLNNKNFLYHKATTQYGWKVYVIEDADAFLHNIGNQFVWVGTGLVAVLAIFLFFAYNLSSRITAPLISLLQSEDKLRPEVIESNETSKEFSDMAKKLKRSSYLMKNYENRLKLQVEEKTEKLEQLNLLLAAQAREDSLTGLLNRSGFNELALNAIKTSYRLAQPFSLAILDLDLFKLINDTYGHPFGDKCLVEFSDLLKRHCKRDTDIIGRYGGEEFVIYISAAEISSQHNIITKIHEHTRSLEILDSKTNKMVKITASIGVCTVVSAINLDLSDLIKIADDELYNCKRNGRDQISIREVGKK